MSQLTGTERLESRIRFLSGDRYVPITTAEHLEVQAASPTRSWRGVHIELGLADRWNGEDLMVDGHFLSMNRTGQPLHVHIRDERTGAWIPNILSPGGFWIHPEGGPFSLRCATSGPWSAAIVNGHFLDQVLGEHHELRGGINLIDPLLEALFRAVMAELLDPSQLPTVTESVIATFVLALGSRHGHKASECPAASVLDQAALDALFLWTEARLHTRLTVSEMAGHIGFSAARFAREFKRAAGQAPWEYVIERRLQKAARLLAMGAKVAEVALDCGFFDQAHFSRAFKARFDISPSHFTRQTSRNTV